MLHRRDRRFWTPLTLTLLLLPAAGPAPTVPVLANSTSTVASIETVSFAKPVPLPAVSAAPAIQVLIARSGDTLAELLADAGVGRSEAEPALTALEPWFPARGLQPGNAVTVRQDRSHGAALVSLEVEPKPGRTLLVSRGPRGWTVEEEQAEQRRHLVLARGQVDGGLFENLKSAGLPASLALGLINTLTHELDFQRDLKPGDSFKILFEHFRDLDGGLLRNGQVLHVELLVSGRCLSLWRHRAAAGFEWYDEAGHALRQAFLRTPLDGAQIVSAFGPRRHPVLGFTRVHQGIDFAAPTGTPVFAAADGIVLSRGMARGFGRLVRLRHANGMETSYAHLSAFAPNLRPGSPVAQGEAIGRVGSSGLATGPHLHYEVTVAGRLVDPATLPAEAAARLTGPELAAFQATRQTLQASLARLQPMQEVAAAD